MENGTMKLDHLQKHEAFNLFLQDSLADGTVAKYPEMIRRFKAHRLIKGVQHTYKYYLTKRAKGLLFAYLH